MRRLLTTLLALDGTVAFAPLSLDDGGARRNSPVAARSSIPFGMSLRYRFRDGGR